MACVRVREAATSEDRRSQARTSQADEPGSERKHLLCVCGDEERMCVTTSMEYPNVGRRVDAARPGRKGGAMARPKSCCIHPDAAPSILRVSKTWRSIEAPASRVPMTTRDSIPPVENGVISRAVLAAWLAKPYSHPISRPSSVFS